MENASSGQVAVAASTLIKEVGDGSSDIEHSDAAQVE